MELKVIDGEVKSPDVKNSIKATQASTDKILNTVIPTESDVKRFLGLIHHIREQNEAANEWAESFRSAVKVHDNTASRFEIAFLGAEIGIVIASVGLLLVKKAKFARGAWGMAIILGLGSMGVAIATKINNTHELHAAEEKISESEHHFTSLNRDKEDIAEDKVLEEEILGEFHELKKLLEGS